MTMRFDVDPRFFIVVMGGLFVLELIHRLYSGFVPHDLTAYLAAVDVFSQGKNPYTSEIEASAIYGGYPFVYPPASLWLMYPLGWIPASVVSALDWVLRVACITLSLEWLRRAYLPEIHMGYVLMGSVLCLPFLVDAVAGNLATYMFSLFLVAFIAARDARMPLGIVTGFVCGFLMGVKPIWGLPSFYAALSVRSYGVAFALAAGVFTFLGLGVLFMPELHVDWVARAQEVNAFYIQGRFALLQVSVWLLAFVALLGSGAALFLLYRARMHPWLWLIGCVSLPIWPKTTVYSYVLLVPLGFFLMSRFGVKKGLLLATPFWGPLAVMVFLADSFWGEVMVWVYTALSAVFLIVLFAKEGPSIEQN